MNHPVDSFGGPAFPVETSETIFLGMTLRDYFAAKAMQADLEYQGLEGREDLTHIAKMAYAMADAMIAECEKLSYQLNPIPK